MFVFMISSMSCGLVSNIVVLGSPIPTLFTSIAASPSGILSNKLLA
jgi:hypothetical protein